jgi:hypothetical protein
MRFTKATCCLLFFFGVQGFVLAQGDDRSKYVGYKYDGVVPRTLLPNGVNYLGGGLLGDIDADPVYGISEVENVKTKMLWLQVSTGRNDRGITGWQVRDVLTFPNLPRTMQLISFTDSSTLCRRDGKEIKNLIAFGHILRKQGIYKVRRAWIANIRLGKFIQTTIRGLKCEYYEP